MSTALPEADVPVSDSSLSARCVEYLRHQWAAFRSLISLQHNFTVRFFCVLLMGKCCFVALTGRGVVSIIQAILGLIFSIEGFWGAVKYDAATVRRFLAFVVGYFFVTVGISIINIQTISDYCESALDEDDRNNCTDTATQYSYMLLGFSLGLVPIVFAVTVVFYLAIPAHGGPRRRNGHSSALDVYEMTDIVERMGFSSD